MGIKENITDWVQKLVDSGLDGVGPFDSSIKVAEQARAQTPDVEAAINRVVSKHTRTGAAAGFVTGIGGFVTLPIALPANVVEFYMQAARMVGAIASLRGHDLADEQVRTKVLMVLVGSSSDDLVTKVSSKTGTGRFTKIALKRTPPAAQLLVNKAIGLRVIRDVGEKTFSRLGRGIPLAGGAIGAALDGYAMKKIADRARQEFAALPNDALPNDALPKDALPKPE